MKRFDPFDGYTINVFWDDDGEYLAHFVELPNISAFGESPEDALRELQTAWEGVKESYQKHGEPVPVLPALRHGHGLRDHGGPGVYQDMDKSICCSEVCLNPGSCHSYSN